MNMIKLEATIPDIVLNEINQMKKEREADENRLASIVKTKKMATN
jgi:hypothetical protein